MTAAGEVGALERARRLILNHGWNATAYQILNPGIERWFFPHLEAGPEGTVGEGVVGFVRSFGYRVVAGSPVCAPEMLPRVVARFEEETHDLGLHSCYFAAGERLAAALAARGPWDRILLGAQPVWHPARWPTVLARKASLRAQLNRARNKGVTVERWSMVTDAEAEPLRACLQDWLSTRGLPPLHFLVEPETLGRLYDRRLFVARQDGGVVGFLVASPVPRRNGWLIEQNIRGAHAPNGTTELLFDGAVRDIAADGAEYVTLGLCPLSRRADVSAPRQEWWLRWLLQWVRAHGRRFYDFDGLDAYKAKFLPERWEPIYAITSERRFGPGTLYAVAGAFGRTAPPWLILRALGRAAGQEWQWLRHRFSPSP